MQKSYICAVNLADDRQLLRACGQLGVEARLPVRFSIGKTERETSWQGRLAHLRQVMSVPDADERLESDVACVASAWCAIRRRLARRCIRQPLQLVLDPHVHPVVWRLSRASRTG